MTEPERVLAERYRLIEPLGQGGMGTVWRAEHVELGSKVAIKLIDAGIAESSDALGRFKREAKAAAALASAHVVQIFDYGVDNGTPYIAMELLDGESLGDRLDRTGTLSPKETLRVLTHAGFALDRAHEAGIVHRDIKPDNIFLTKGEDGEFLGKILDFGVAKAKTQDLAGAASSHTRTGALVGSPYYMSPEQVRHTKDVDHRADLWALGVIAFECLVGSRPFESEALGDLLILICTEDAPVPSERASVPAGFDAWFAKACARKPDDRFQNAKEMVEALRGVIAGEGATSSAGLAASEGSTKAASTAYQQSAPDLAGTGGATDLPTKPKTTLFVGIGIAVVVVVVAVGAFLSGRSAQEAGSSGLVRDAVMTDAEAAPTQTAATTQTAAAPDAGRLVEPMDEDASAGTGGTAEPRPTATARPTTTARPTAPATTTAAPTATATPTAKPTGPDYGF